MQLDRADVVVIGGGVTGLSSAYWLAKSGVDTVLVEKGVVGWEASGRNGGGVQARGNELPLIPLAAESLRLWPDIDEDLGYPTEWSAGRINVALSDEELLAVEQSEEEFREQGIDSEFIDAQTIKELMPIITPEVKGGNLSRKGGHANPQRTSQAYAWAFLDHGGRLHQNTTVTDFEVIGGRVTNVETSRGTIATDYVVCAAGPQIGLLAEKVGAFVPLAPGRVEIVVTAPLERMYEGQVHGNGLYGRQTARGNLAYGGGPHEWIDVDLSTPRKPNTPLIRNIVRRIHQLYPAAAEVPLIRSWAGVVEQTPDYLPILDTLPEPSNFFIATVSAHGFGLCPATGKVVSEVVMHGESSIDISGLSYGRFADVPHDWREQRGWVPAPG